MTKKFTKLLAAILSLAMLLSFCMVPMTASAEDNELRFNEDGKFKIVIFSDTQDRYVVHPRLTSIMRQALDREDPDLVVFLGDQTEMNTKDPDVDFRKSIRQILQPVAEANVPYAFVFGNHDDQSYYSGQRTDKDALLSVYQSIGDCRTVDAEPTLYGTGTCNIPIYSSTGNDMAFNLWMIDSNTYQNPLGTDSGYDNPHADQLAWLQEKQNAITAAEGHVVPSFAFQHIPMPEMWNLFVEDPNGNKSYGDKKYKVELKSGVTGHAGEAPNSIYAADNKGEYNVLKQMGVWNLFTGHDHLNDFSGKFEDDGVTMTAVPGMTYANYGDEAIRGYGVIELDEKDLANYDYHSVKFSTLDAEAGTPAEETYDVYDELKVSDLKENGKSLSGIVNIAGGHLYTYEGNSPSKSAIIKFRWTVGSKTGIQFSFDHRLNAKGDKEISYPFSVWVKKPNDSGAGATGAWHLRPDESNKTIVPFDIAPKQGDTFDIELGRLKVLTGAPENVGQYYVYLKVDGELIMDTYTAVDEENCYTATDSDCVVANELFFADWSGTGNKISDIPFIEEYEVYDSVTFDDLIIDGKSMANQTIDGSQSYEYIATSPTYSLKLSYRWIPGGDVLKFTTFIDDYVFPFCFTAKTPNQDNFGAKAGPNGAWHLVPSDASLKVDMDTPIVAGQPYDIEQGRLKVVNGPNAGKYYVYAKVNGELIASYYYSGVNADGTYDNGTAMSNRLIISADAGNKFTATPVEEADDSIYFDYDEISYNSLLLGGKPLSNETTITGQTVFTYNWTSPTYSTIFTFRWTAGTVAKFSLFFDQSGAYPFTLAAKYPNQSNFGTVAGDKGAWQVDVTKSENLVNLAEPLVPGQSYDIEYGRLKVKRGENVGKYYVYLKVDGKDIVSYYYGDVAADGSYYNGCHLSNNIVFEVWNTENTKLSASPIQEEYDAYDELNFTDLYLGGQPVTGEVTLNGGQTYTYNRTSPSYSAILHYNWTAGDLAKFQMSFDQCPSGDISYPFGVWVKAPFGDGAGETGAYWFLPGETQGVQNPFNYALAAGETLEFEMGRLKVTNGPNAGKYYTYLKIDKELVAEAYNEVDANGQYTFGANTLSLSNEIRFGYWASAVVSNYGKLAPVVIETVYEPYDELNFTDLYLGGQPVTGEVTLNGGQIYTYNRTSPTYSAILHFKWKAGDVAKFQMSFDHLEDGSMSYPFGVWVKEPNGDGAGANGAYWFMPGQSQGVQNDFDHPLAAGDTVDFEIGRLKIKSGPNAGKYYTYLKIDKQLVGEAYNEVGADGQYTFGANTLSLSNEILFGYWSGAVVNNLGKLGPVAPEMGDHEGLRGDIDNNGVVDVADVVALKQVILGVLTVADGIADYNIGGVVDVRDLIAMKKDFAASNNHTRTGALAFGMQEHVNEDQNKTDATQTKTAAYIADATATMGASYYRLGFGLNRLFYVIGDSNLGWNDEEVAVFQEQIDQLTQRGITEILYVSDAFVIPTNYVHVDDQFVGHNITIPDPVTERDTYISWLNLNAQAFRMVATRFPEIKYIEPFNEPNLTSSRMERRGVNWSATEEEQAPYKFTVKEKAGIMADVCWYVSNAVKSVNPAIQVTTPAISYDNNNKVEKDFFDELYKCIETGNYPTGQTVADKRIDNYFTILAVHTYPNFQDKQSSIDESGYVSVLNEFYNVAKAHGDGDSRVWLTETGITDNGTRNTTNVAANMNAALNALDTQVKFVDVAFIYKLANVSEDNGLSAQETNFGIFYSGDDLEHPYEAKPIAKAIYKFINGSTDYSALTALAERWNKK